MKKFVVLISGNGTNLQSIINAIAEGRISGQICGVICNRPNAYGIVRAKQAKIPYFIFDRKSFKHDTEMDLAIATQIEALEADFIVLAGYMKILTPTFIQRFYGKIINIHPSLLPKYPGLDTHQRALMAGEKIHGMTIHFVNEEVDGGAIILQVSVPIDENDNVESLASKVREKEHYYYPIVIEWLCQSYLQLIDNRVYLDKNCSLNERLNNA